MTSTPPAQLEMLVPPDPGADGFALPSRSYGRQALRRYLRSPVSVTALAVFVLVIGGSFIAPYFYRWKYNVADTAHPSVPPGHEGHILGTDETGFDLLARMFRGTQRDFIIVVVATGVALTLGVLVGAVAGYYGRLADNLLMRIVDVLLAVPTLVVLVIACNRFSIANTAWGIGVIFGLFGWMGLSRLIRAQLLSLREREFVEAARALGASDFRIIFRHLIPNVLGTILVFATLFSATSIVVETSITYLGYGVKPPDTSLGLLVSRGVDAAETRPWLFYYPGIAILVIVLATNLIGEGVRSAFDPRHNRVRD